jgi:hypothetical protein
VIIDRNSRYRVNDRQKPVHAPETGGKFIRPFGKWGGDIKGHGKSTPVVPGQQKAGKKKNKGHDPFAFDHQKDRKRKGTENIFDQPHNKELLVEKDGSQKLISGFVAL